MTAGKLFICIWTLSLGAIAQAHDGKGAWDPELAARIRKANEDVSGPVQSGPATCEALAEKKQTYAEKRLEEYLTQVVGQLGHLPQRVMRTAVTCVVEGPKETLAILLEVSKGVFDENGKKIHEPLNRSQLNLLFTILNDIGPAQMPQIYYSLAVDRDPELFLTKLGDAFTQKKLDQNSPRMKELLKEFEAKFMHLEPAMRTALAHIVLDNPAQNLEMMIKLSRELTKGELATLTGNVMPALGPQAMLIALPKIYTSVGGDSILFFETINDLAIRVEMVKRDKSQKNLVSEEEWKLLAEITLN